MKIPHIKIIYNKITLLIMSYCINEEIYKLICFLKRLEFFHVVFEPGHHPKLAAA